MTQTKIVNLLFSNYKSMRTISCHINQSSYPTGTKIHTIIRSPNLWMLYVKYEKNWPAASEEKSFENVDDGRTTDTSIYYKLTLEPSAQVS